jgi:hypothetical protein
VAIADRVRIPTMTVASHYDAALDVVVATALADPA